MLRWLPLPLFALAGCGEAVRDDHFANQIDTTRIETPPPETSAVPVRVGELGPNFDACSAAGTTRNLSAGQSLGARAAPFDSAAALGEIAPGARFFVCSRSHDQRWFGIVWDESGELAEGCGVSSPVAERRDYEGPCRSGWVPSAFVKTIAG